MNLPLHFIGFDEIIGILIGAYTAVASFLFLTLKNKRNLRRKRADDFFKSFQKGLELDVIDTLEDVYNIYKGTHKNHLEVGDFRKNVDNLLKKFLVKLINDSDKIDSKKLVLWKNKIDNLIHDNEKESPFSELPTVERNILMDVMSFIDKGDKLSLERKVKELSSSIQIRSEQLARLEKLNKWSIPIAAIGLLFTVVFGIMSII